MATREAAGLTGQDYANVALGVIAMVGTFMMGKIAVESIVAAREERFNPKGQPAAAVEAKETTLDGLVKVAGMVYGMWMMKEQLPQLAKELEGYLK